MERIDLADFFLFLRVAAVVRQVVVAFGHVHEGIAAVAAFVGEHESANTGQIAAEGQHHQVAHQLQVLGIVLRHAVGLSHAGRQLRIDRLAEFLDAILQLAHRFQVLVELAHIGGAELALERLGILQRRIEDALAIALALGGGLGILAGLAPSKEPLEDQLRVDLFGVGRRFAAPGDVRGISTAIAAVAAAGLPARLATVCEPMCWAAT